MAKAKTTTKKVVPLAKKKIFDQKAFSKAFSDFVEKNGYNWKQLTETLGVTHPTIARMLYKNQEVKIETYAKTCVWMKVSLDKFIKK